MISISEIRPFTKELRFVRMPAVRIIGRTVRNGGSLGNTAPSLWDRVFASGDNVVLQSLPRVSGSDLFGWTCEYDPSDKTFVYIVCAMTPEGTPVPEGFEYRDLPETVCALGLYGESVNKTLTRCKEAGYRDGWSQPGCGWNAEAYFNAEEENPPKKVKAPWHWLVPVVPV